MSRDRIGLVGYGYWGEKLASNMAAFANDDKRKDYRFEFVALAESERDKQLKALAKYPYISIYASLGAMIAEARLDAVVIATPPDSHVPLVRYALNYGLDVLVEKPMALEYVDAIHIEYVARTTNRCVMVDHTVCYDPKIKIMKHQLSCLRGPSYFLATRINYAPERLVKHDCNVIWDLAPHDLAVVDYLTDGKRAQVVETHGTDTAAVINVTYEDSHKATLVVSWEGPGRQRNFIATGKDNEGYVFHYDALLNEMTRGNLHKPEQQIEETPLLNMLSAFNRRAEIGAIRTDAKHGLRVVEILDAANRSLKSGLAVAL